MTKYIFTLGGVVSSLGKGIANASLGCLLKSRGYSVRLRKMDPYLNIDPGTMSPYQHGEVFITDDGAETDLDLGHYERFADINCHKTDSISGGKIYWNVLEKERRGDFLGKTVQAIPHITNEIKNFLLSDLHGEDFVLYEVGGTVGDIEGTLFIEAIRQFINDVGRENCCVVLLTLLPYIATAGELKTKPTQHSVRKLLEAGIQANILLCRSQIEISDDEREKLALFCNVNKEDVIQALDVDNINKIPLSYHKEGLDNRVLNYFNLLKQSKEPDLSCWKNIVNSSKDRKNSVKIAVVGKYCGLPDTYKSLNEALSHAGNYDNIKLDIDWINSESLESLSKDEVEKILSKYQGILVPGGFGNRGIEGKITAANFARTHNIPFFGICLGMQIAAIEACRNVLGLKDANSSEFSNNCCPIISKMKIWEQNGKKMIRPENSDLGGTMRLGSYPCNIKKDSLAYQIYKSEQINERHRHRFELDIKYIKDLESKGIILSGISPDGLLPEIIEIPENKFFIGVQFHPEFKSRPTKPSPIFVSFINACLENHKD